MFNLLLQLRKAIEEMNADTLPKSRAKSQNAVNEEQIEEQSEEENERNGLRQ